MRVVRFDEVGRLIGHGLYGNVYEYKDDMVIKVFFPDSEEEPLVLAEDEIRGSKISKYALPVIELVRFHQKTFQTYALIKKKLCNMASKKEIDDLYETLINSREEAELAVDLHNDNVMKDKDGQIYVVDTQLLSWY